MLIPEADIRWVMTQKPAVTRLFFECWLCDRYGSRWTQLNTSLKSSAFSDAKKILSEQGLFAFRRETSMLDGRSTVCWTIKNLHGSRVKDFWQGEIESTATEQTSVITDLMSALTDNTSTDTNNTSTSVDSISPQTQSQQAFQNASISFQYLLDQQQFNSVVVVDEKVIEEEEEEDPSPKVSEEGADAPSGTDTPAPTSEEVRSCLAELRRMGMILNPSIQKTVKEYFTSVPDAIAHLKERINQGEQFRNLGGAFVKACREGAHAIRRSFARTELNPPAPEQRAALDAAKMQRKIRDYYLAPYKEGLAVLVDTGRQMMPWWEYLEGEK